MALALVAIAGCGDDRGEERTGIGPTTPPTVDVAPTSEPRVGPTAPPTSANTTTSTASPPTEPETTTAPAQPDGSTDGDGPVGTPPATPPAVTTRPVPVADLVPAAATPVAAAVAFVSGMLAGDDVSLVGKPEAVRAWVGMDIPIGARWTGQVVAPPEHNEIYEGELVCEVWGDHSPVCVVALVPGPGDDVPSMLLQLPVSFADEYLEAFVPVPGTEHPPMVVDVYPYTPGGP